MTIFPYTWREQTACFPRRDVLDALGAPPHVKQARIIVFASSQRAAHGALLRLNIAPRTARHLGPAHGTDVRAIIAAGRNKEGNVFVIYRTAVVAVCPTDLGHYIVRLEDASPEITDAMFDAALGAVPDEFVHIVAKFMGEAIGAALRARGETTS